MAQSTGSPSDPRTYWTKEFLNSWGVSMIDAEYAYARGVDGSGIEVGVIDSGVATDHPELQGHVAGGYDYVTRSPLIVDGNGHGTAVASIITGKRDGSGIHGVAPGARVVSARVFDDAGWIDDDATIVGEAWSALLDRGVRILNNSWGTVDYELAERSVESVESFMPRILAASRSSVERGGLLIFITHNEGLSQPNLESSLPYLFPELERGWLAVTAVGASRELASYASACGVAKAWCLAAPGGDWDDGFGLWMAAAEGGYREAVGTSYAAPHVAGAAALVWQMFPNFTTDQVRQTLLGTAIDLGAPGVDDLYGYGLLSVRRAVQGPGRFDWGDFHVVQPLGVSNWYNDIVGAGGLIKSGPGALVLHGDNAYTGLTRVNEGLLAVVGAISSPTFIGYDGAIAGQGTVRGSVWNEGYIGPGDPWLAGELTFEGDFVNTPTGVIVGQVAPGGLTNKLVVAGAADLKGGAVEVVVTPGLYRRSFTQALLSASAGVHGGFDEVIGEDYAFLKPSLSYDAGAVYLTLTRLPFDDRSVCAGANACGVGGALERGLDTGDADFLSGATALQGLSTEGARTSLSSLSGEAHASLASIALRGGGPGLSARLTELRADGADQGAWLRGYGQWGRVGSDPDASGADHRVGGVMAGSDWQVSPDLRLGASFGYSSTDVDFDRFDGKGTIKTYEGGLYGVYSRGPFGLDSWLSYAALSTEVGRTIVIDPKAGRAVSDYDGDRIAAFTEASYLIDLGGVAARPLGSLRYVALRQDGFSEEGVGGLGLAAAAQSLDSLESGVGLGLSAPFGVREATGKIEARAKWMHEFLDDRGELDAAFIGAPTASFTSRGPRMSRDSALLGLGVVAQAGKAVEIFANYDARLSTTGAAHAAGAGLRITW